jgi:hypothetical protein
MSQQRGGETELEFAAECFSILRMMAEAIVHLLSQPRQDLLRGLSFVSQTSSRSLRARRSLKIQKKTCEHMPIMVIPSSNWLLLRIERKHREKNHYDMLWSLSKDAYLWSILILFLLYYSAHQISAAKDNNNMPFTKNNHHGGDDVAAVVVAVQLFLVRHGETEGNKLGLTLGQSDSVS